MVREGCFVGIEERNALRFPSLRRTGAVGRSLRPCQAREIDRERWTILYMKKDDV